MKLAKQYGIEPWDGKYIFDLRDAVGWQRDLQVADPCVSRGTC